MTIIFVLKNGKEIAMKCESFSSSERFLSNGMINGYSVSGITENQIIGINFEEVVAIYRVLSDEVKTNG